MPKVTDREYQMEGFIIEKMDLAIKRVMDRKLDAVFLIDGDEGFGKSSLSILLGYYAAYKTGREFNLNNVFFDPKEFIKFVNSTKQQVVIWDEAALGGLASNWQNKVQQMLIQTLMTCRFRRHIIIFNCPKFYRLNLYFVADRAAGLFHVYSDDGINAGRLAFYKKDVLENMMTYYSTKRRKPYKIFYNKWLRGHFIDAFKLNIIDEDEYDTKKEKYTEKLLAQYGDSRYNTKLLKLQHNVASIKSIPQQDLAKDVGVSAQTLVAWKKIPSKYPEIFKEIA